MKKFRCLDCGMSTNNHDLFHKHLITNTHTHFIIRKDSEWSEKKQRMVPRGRRTKEVKEYEQRVLEEQLRKERKLAESICKPKDEKKRSSETKCSNCGATYREIVNYCEKCGTELSNNSYYLFKIVIFGAANSGKAELMKKCIFQRKLSPDTKGTLGIEIFYKEIEIDGKRNTLQLWDVSSRESIRELLEYYSLGSRGGIFVYNITDYSTIARIDDWLMKIKKKDEPLFPIIVVGVQTSTDLLKQREVNVEDAIRITKSRNLDGCMECNMNTGENVEEVFKTLTRLMLKRMEE